MALTFRARHLPDWEYGTIPGAVRVLLRDNICCALVHGASPDDEHQAHQIRAFVLLEDWLPHLPGSTPRRLGQNWRGPSWMRARLSHSAHVPKEIGAPHSAGLGIEIRHDAWAAC